MSTHKWTSCDNYFLKINRNHTGKSIIKSRTWKGELWKVLIERLGGKGEGIRENFSYQNLSALSQGCPCVLPPSLTSSLSLLALVWAPPTPTEKLVADPHWGRACWDTDFLSFLSSIQARVSGLWLHCSRTLWLPLSPAASSLKFSGDSGNLSLSPLQSWERPPLPAWPEASPSPAGSRNLPSLL